MSTKENIYDTIIIGGGPSGSTAASILAKSGRKVLVLEKENFPREHVGESLLPFCYQIFEDLGVIDAMKERFSRKPGVTFSDSTGTTYTHWCFSSLIDGPDYLSFHVRRAEFDQLLLNNSQQHGVTVREGTKVVAIDYGNATEAIKVKATNDNEEDLMFRTRYVIDASGQDSFMAKTMKNKKPFKNLKRRIAFSTHWKNTKMDSGLKKGNLKIIHLEGKKLGWIWMIPLAGERLSIGVVVNMDYVKEHKKNLTGESDRWQDDFYLSELMQSDVVKQVIQGAETFGDVMVNGDYSYYMEKKWGDRFACIGDASAFLDPIFASGIYLAMKSAQLVAEAVNLWLDDEQVAHIEKTYENINGAYQFLEMLIGTFYEPESIRLAEVNQAKGFNYQNFEEVHFILHHILAGDFFSNHAKYSKALGMLKNPDMREKFKNLVGYDRESHTQSVCS